MTSDLLHLQPLEGSRNVVLSDVVRRGLLENLLSTYCISPAGRYLGMSPLSSGMEQGLQRSMATRRRTSEPGRSKGSSQLRRLPPSGEPSGVSAAEQGPTARTLYRPVQLSASFALSTLASVFAFTPWRMVGAELHTYA